MGRLLPVLAATCASLAVLGTAALAAPRLEVKARTAIELDTVLRIEGGVVVRGRVVDANSGEPIGRAEVDLQLAGLSEQTITNDEGAFSVPFAVSRETLDISVRAFGPALGESRTELTGLAVKNRPLALTLTIGPITTTEVIAVVRASSDGAEVPNLETQLSIDDEPAGRIRTNSDGRGEARLPRTGGLALPGRKTFRVSFAGNDIYDPATSSTTELLKVETSLRLQLESTETAYEDTISARGLLQDLSERPVRAARVDLVSASGDVLASEVTDERGEFLLEVDANELGPGLVSIQAVFQSPQPWFESSRSKTHTVTIAEPEPIPVSYTLGAFGATAFALLAFVGARTRPWQKWYPKPADGATERAIDDTPIPTRPVEGGLVEAKPNIISTLRRASDFGISVIVRDAATWAVIADARVALTLGSETLETLSESNGTAGLEGLPPGQWQVTAQAKYYVAESFSVQIPHRGELRNARVDLVPVRERIFDLYRAAALPLLPRPGLWGIWTPRQIIEHVKTHSHHAPALEALTSFVEESYFSARRPLESALGPCADLVVAATAEAAG